MFGPRIYDAFRSVKAAFDPHGIMNPGKIVDSPPMTNDLRYTPDYRPLQLRTGLGYSTEGSFAGAVEMCNGQGACRKVTSGTMCPSYMVTRGRGALDSGPRQCPACGLVGGAAGRLPHEP